MKEPVHTVLPLPAWFIKLCCWFWDKRFRIWGLIGSSIGAVLLWIAGLWFSSNAAAWNSWPLKGSAKPENDKAWEALKQGMMSHTSKVRDVVEKLLKRAQRI